ncbi:uncharacterized protein PSANT_03126 [Moesziomyces antarcticus]|uniref:Uncharacterized protein n=1 Tax=Pseudozyma antarctica TaxID=84753 RepID=A0A5C3FMI7_PSEA2|nr:uncharacterized protein PSANT_03126 [Moesziomyces antarcticus]
MDGVGRLAAVPTVWCLCVCVWFQTWANRLDRVSMKLERTIPLDRAARIPRIPDDRSGGWRARGTIEAEKNAAMQEQQGPRHCRGIEAGTLELCRAAQTPDSSTAQWTDEMQSETACKVRLEICEQTGTMTTKL